MKSVAIGKRVAPWSLAVVLGLGGSVWGITTAIAPQIAQAYTARATVTLTRTGFETYETLLQRAEAAARAAAQRSFDNDLLATDVAIVIVAQNNGSSAPILTLEATRQQWSRRPDPSAWATYLPNAEVLLGFTAPEITSPTAQPIPPPPPTQPTAIPGQPLLIPGQPGVIPVQPGVVPVQPGVVPAQPGVIPAQPVVVPVQPGAVQVQPQFQPGQQTVPGVQNLPQAVPQPQQVAPAPQQVAPQQAVPQQTAPQQAAPQQAAPQQAAPQQGGGGLICQGGVCRPTP